MTAAKAKKQEVPALDEQLLNVAHMDEIIEEHEIEVEEDATAKDKADAIRDWFDENASKNDLADCDNCHGVSDINLESCPYCGEGDNEGADAVAPPAPAPTAAQKAAASRKAKSTALASAPAVSQVVPAMPPGVTVSALNEAVAQVVKEKSQAAVSYWKLGRALGAIYDGQLWKARTVEGKPVHRNFNVFCTEELSMGGSAALRMIDVAKAFTEADVVQFGRTKVGLLLEAPEEYREKLIDQIKAGASKRTLQDEVKKVKKGKRVTGRKPTPQGAPPPRPKAKEITIQRIIGKFNIKLWKKPVGKVDESTLVAAKRLADEPYGWHDLPNGVRMHYLVAESPSGQLILKIDTRRTE